ncbi:MAG: MBL fold metallo-hydrolase [Fusobacteriota bacterium]
MVKKDNIELNYEEPIEIEEGIFWCGFLDEDYALHCNPYLIKEGGEAVVIDGGSRTDFSTVMMKILQTGVDPKNIKYLIYQHYDPDLCTSIPDFEEIIGTENVNILSHSLNNVFIKYYGGRSRRDCIENTLNFEYKFKTGRKLKFIKTPYCHAGGSFITFDEKTGTLFTSDIFGSYARNWDLFLTLDNSCKSCQNYETCYKGKAECPLGKIKDFHRKIMTSKKALNYALDLIEKLPVKQIAPQHGSVINKKEYIEKVINVLKLSEKIGIDGIVE